MKKLFYMINFHRIVKISFLMCMISTLLYSVDNTTDKSKISVFDANYVPKDENLKKMPVSFNLGGSVSTTSHILFKTFQTNPDGGFEPVPNDRWFIDLEGKIWTRLSFRFDRYIHLGARALVKFERYDDYYKRNSIVPLFNIDEFYFNWAYPIGKVIIGRTNYNLKSAMIFNGPLDGLEVDINVPYLNFKSFFGFTGVLGLFHPWFNPYSVTSIDRSFKEDTNLIYSQMYIKLNAEQARRIFFATDFDIHFYSQHINPYFLMQIDLTSLYYNLNTSNDVNTFHVGLNVEGRIIKNLYYKLNLSGLFGTHPSSEKGVVKPIIACAFESNLRYTIPKVANSTIILSYALGTGNSEPIGEWSDYKTDRKKGFWSDKYDGSYHKKFYYYGKFDGGFVLNPILSNIHSVSIKYLVSPVQNGNFDISIYAGVYQTIKLLSSGPISDDECDLNAFLVGSEIDAGMIIKPNSYFNFSFDLGLFIPETAYSDKSLRFKAGASMGITF